MPFEPSTSGAVPHYLDQFGPGLGGRFISEPGPPDLGPPPPKPPALPVPTTVSEADAQIARMIIDRKFGDRLLNGDPVALREFHAAHEAKENESGQVDQLLDGKSPVLQTGEGQLPIQAQLDVIESFRILGLSDGAIREAFEGTPVSKAELETVRLFRERRLADKEFTKRYLSGDLEARREMTLANIVLTNGAVDAGRF
jgi:hypothetical protein